MRGEIADYKESLRRRVALLQGRDGGRHGAGLHRAAAAQPRRRERWCGLQGRRPEGAAGLRRLHLLHRPRARPLGIDYTRSNVLEIRSGANCGELTGRMVDQPWGDICDGAEKRKMLLETCAQLGISPKQAIAMGDGANDLPMMGEAGLSVAYHAKPKVREQAMVAINRVGWTGCWNGMASACPAPGSWTRAWTC
jgi:phosphoserine phosphatase